MAKARLKHIDLNARDEELYARIPKRLKRELKARGQKAGRNQTQELILRLFHSLSEHEVIPGLPDWMET